MIDTKLVKSVKVETDGRIVIPTEIALESGFSAGNEVVIIKRGKSVLLFHRHDFLPFLDALSTRMQEEMEHTGSLTSDAKFLFNLSVKEYAGLSEEKETELWAKYHTKENDRLNN